MNLPDFLQLAKEAIRTSQSLLDSINSADDPARISELSAELAKIQRRTELARAFLIAHEDLVALKQLICEDPLDKELKDELSSLQARLESAEQDFKALFQPNKQSADVAILEFNPGAGGDEAGIFAYDLFCMYQKYAEYKSWSWEVRKENYITKNALKEAVVRIKGPKVFDILSLEGGVHRVQRVPLTESAGRIHTSTATLAVLADLPSVSITIDPKDLKMNFTRSGGKGGQSVNTTDSKVQITHIPTGQFVEMQEERSQLQNKEKALALLKERLLAVKQQEQLAEINSARNSQSKNANRSDKIRTYNYPQNRITDHLRSVTVNGLDRIMLGKHELERFLQKIYDASS